MQKHDARVEPSSVCRTVGSTASGVLASPHDGHDRPKRIQRKRAKGWKMPANTVYVGRPSRWGNPCRVTQGDCDHPDCGPRAHPPITAEKAVAVFKVWLAGMLQRNPAFTDALTGKDLACWCPLDQPCHADVLLEIANG